MNVNKHILVTQSFGRESEYRRVIFSILTAVSYLKEEKINDFKIILFTDKPSFFTNWFQGLNIYFVELTPDKIKTMRGDIDFLHRMKIALIEEAFQLFPEHNMFYVDSDTFFIKDPIIGFGRISESISSMHLLEYKFESLKNMELPAGLSFRAFYNLVTSQPFLLNNGSKLEVFPSDESWNAGVMCLHHSHEKYIKDVYKLTEQFYPETVNHASEQYAFSIILQKNTKLIPCDDLVYHYWHRVKKNIIDEELSKKDFINIERLLLNEKLFIVKKYSTYFPHYFENHFYTLMDNCIQSFNENNFRIAYIWYIRSFFKSPFTALKRTRDVLYHTKRFFLNIKL